MTWIRSAGARCTGVAAAWCPVHGNCACPPDPDRGVERSMTDADCPLHARTSTHGDDQ